MHVPACPILFNQNYQLILIKIDWIERETTSVHAIYFHWDKKVNENPKH
jgi:hypothetical protein